MEITDSDSGIEGRVSSEWRYLEGLQTRRELFEK
jgi:hypothetical protein